MIEGIDPLSNQLTEYEVVSQECQDMFHSKRKMVHAISLLIVFVGKEIMANVEAELLIKQMQMGYEMSFLEDL